eukprot:Hpha_TRINITY_DN15640_c8_g1::TRINITY_DN15640_c8_g1_i2::g.97858::m.97858
MGLRRGHRGTHVGTNLRGTAGRLGLGPLLATDDKVAGVALLKETAEAALAHGRSGGTVLAGRSGTAGDGDLLEGAADGLASGGGLGPLELVGAGADLALRPVLPVGAEQPAGNSTARGAAVTLSLGTSRHSKLVKRTPLDLPGVHGLASRGGRTPRRRLGTAATARRTGHAGSDLAAVALTLEHTEVTDGNHTALDAPLELTARGRTLRGGKRVEATALHPAVLPVRPTGGACRAPHGLGHGVGETRAGDSVACIATALEGAASLRSNNSVTHASVVVVLGKGALRPVQVVERTRSGDEVSPLTTVPQGKVELTVAPDPVCVGLRLGAPPHLPPSHSLGLLVFALAADCPADQHTALLGVLLTPLPGRTPTDLEAALHVVTSDLAPLTLLINRSSHCGRHGHHHRRNSHITTEEIYPSRVPRVSRTFGV